MAAFCSALIGFLTYIASESELQSLVFWQMGSLARANWADVAAVVPLFAIGVFALQRLATPLDMLALGERQAQHLGLDVTRTRRRLLRWPGGAARGASAGWPRPSLAAAVVRPAGRTADCGGRYCGAHARPAGRDSVGPVLGRAGRAVLPLAGAAAAPQGRAMSVLLKLHEVVVRRQQREILHGISLAFEPGTVTALVGPNGAGKSTLLAVAAGDLRADAGEVSLRGKPLAGYKAGPLARERAVMPQEHGVRFAFSVEEVVAMGRLPHPPDPVADGAHVEGAIDAAELQALRLREVQQLSGGESARTTFARVLAQDTPLLLLDEPTAALDLRHQERTLRSVRACAEAGACVIVVLHDLNLAAGYADRIVLLEQGRVAADGTPLQVLTEDNLQRVYQQDVVVLQHPRRGVPLVVVT
ncbi:hypothetical protein G6F65_014811 [Rhizopus arrhizus]|nr:hypothetical protein G6F65_014811 [Rhizopus arrhizus]